MTCNIFPHYTIRDDFVWDAEVLPGSEAVVKMGNVGGRRAALRVPHPLAMQVVKRMRTDQVHQHRYHCQRLPRSCSRSVALQTKPHLCTADQASHADRIYGVQLSWNGQAVVHHYAQNGPPSR